MISTGRSQDHVDGLLQSIENGKLAAAGEDLFVTRRNSNMPIEMIFTDCQGLGVNREHEQWWVLPISSKDAKISANTYLWVLPLNAESQELSWNIELHDGTVSATKTEAGLKVSLNTDRATIHKSEARPHSDPFNHRFSLKITGGKELEDALAAFYWGTMLPLVVEKTMAANFPYSSGYVLSTLKVSSYAGSYPAVDHEFQIKGRLAMGSELDLDVVRRMIEMQLKLMNDDPERLSRAPTSVQPDGKREYHVRRNSKDNRQNAAMFPLTGDIEVMEEAWHYYEARKDVPWLRSNIENLEHAAAWIEASIDQYGRVWSDVYYEDQVIKDGRETQAQAFAAYAFGLLSNMESVLGRQTKAASYSGVSRKIASALTELTPMGYWDEKNHRFVDWIDRNGKIHDHIHLLANALPVTFGYATPIQANAVSQLIAQNDKEFERFPSFLSADIAGYDNSEIGDGGPYDLSAAGRYWYWDAAFRESHNQNKLLFNQLEMVAAEGMKNNYFMGERYDMDHVYYIDGKNAHGAEQYYEYPNVYAAVLISKFLGLSIPVDADVAVAPHITSYGSVELGTPQYALRYSYDKDGFVLKNLSDRRRRFKVDLTALSAASPHYQLPKGTNSRAVGAGSIITLAPREEARWILAR
ncbi:hypothetical protein [Granulicella arctica]|uniref:hypothetical protein n=1 Tax=Granulicella arctica TaxID=940613 RepID=UPI0021E07B5F|nr:hypothetical protein [Granulicella arctica]